MHRIHVFHTTMLKWVERTKCGKCTAGLSCLSLAEEEILVHWCDVKSQAVGSQRLGSLREQNYWCTQQDDITNRETLREQNYWCTQQDAITNRETLWEHANYCTTAVLFIYFERDQLWPISAVVNRPDCWQFSWLLPWAFPLSVLYLCSARWSAAWQREKVILDLLFAHAGVAGLFCW